VLVSGDRAPDRSGDRKCGMTKRRHFGSVRKRTSGRWQATYWHDGRLHSAGTFVAKADALAHLSTVEADLRRGAWIDPRAGQVTVQSYANEWLDRRPDLSARTRELYRHLLDRHVIPALGQATLAGLAPSKIRGWHAGLAKSHPSTAAKAYRLLSTIMRTAVIDGLILASPCKVDGAGAERAAERPVASVAEIEALAEAMPESLRLLVLFAAWCQLRRGELLGLRRRDIDVMHATIHIEQSRTFTMNGRSLTKEPKTTASRRSLAIPGHLMALVADHLEQFTERDPNALIFSGSSGSPLTRNGLQAAWGRARVAVGRPDLHLHDLRHTGLTLAAATGATTAELMHRAGHASASAALRYQHATVDRDRVLADALANLVSSATVTRLGATKSSDLRG
jgi:integrase